MGAGIVVAFDAIASHRQYLPIWPKHHGPYRHFAIAGSQPRLLQGYFHRFDQHFLPSSPAGGYSTL